MGIFFRRKLKYEFHKKKTCTVLYKFKHFLVEILKTLTFKMNDFKNRSKVHKVNKFAGITNNQIYFVYKNLYEHCTRSTICSGCCS